MTTEHRYPVHFQLNGKQTDMIVSSEQTLLELLREDLRAWEVK